VLAGHEVALALILRADGDHQAFALAEGAVEVAPGFELGDAVRTPAATKELDDQRANGKQISRANQPAARVFQGKLGSQRAYRRMRSSMRSRRARDGALAHSSGWLAPSGGCWP